MKKQLYNFTIKWIDKYFCTWSKTGRIIVFKQPGKANMFFFPVTGILAVVRFLIRIIPRPCRVAYPCQKIAAGIGAAFLIYPAGLFSSLVVSKEQKPTRSVFLP